MVVPNVNYENWRPSLLTMGSPDDNGRTITTKVKENYFVFDNSWIVLYSKLLSKTFKAHCHAEYCNSVKSIKYICKYVTKDSSDNIEPQTA